MHADERMNTRVLVIDDDASVREGFRVALRTRPTTDPRVQSAARVLFDDGAPPSPRAATIEFEVDLAEDGPRGVALARAAIEAERPYAVIFCDMRMPGLDGVETVERIREFDRRAEVVFVTAFSDHSVDAVVARTGANVGYFVKPFLSEEIRQIATKLVVEWNKARELEALLRAVSTLRGERASMKQVVSHLLREICLWLDTDSAAILRRSDDGRFEFELGVGALVEGTAVAKLTARLNGALAEHLRGDGATSVSLCDDGTFVLPIHPYGAAVALPGGARITPDRRYLLEVFLESAALALRNCEIAARLDEAERLAAAGRALGFVLHDVRNPLGAAQLMLHALRSDATLTREALGSLAKIGGELERAVELIRDTMALCSGRLVVHPRQVEVGEVLNDEGASWRVLLASRGVAVEVDAPEGITLYADPTRLSRVLYNLTRNAADAVEGRPERRISLSARRVAGGVELRVCDDGEGVPAEVLPALFRPFATLGKEDGTGFGLAIVRQVMEAHGGTARYDREEGKTCFTLRFPDAVTAPLAAVSS